MKKKLLNTKTPMFGLTAEEGFYVARKGTPLSDNSESREVSVAVDEIDQWEEIPIEDVKRAKAEAEAERKYAERVVALIRRRYSADDETAILRKFLALQLTPMIFSADKAEVITAEFDAYNHYAELCKEEAKE